MKQVLFYLKRLPKRFAMAAALASAVIALPLSAVADSNVRLEGSIGVRNISVDPSSNNQYQEATSASYDQVVEFRVFYHNMELPESGKIAENLKVKIDMPGTPGTAQTVKTTITADGANTITDTATVNINRADAYLEYVPGSARWDHNPGARTDARITETIADNIILEGKKLEDAKPCYEYQAYVRFQARVRVPAVKVVKQSRVKGANQQWSNNNIAKPGDTMEYLITYQNIGNTKQENVVVRDNLPPKTEYVPGTTYLTNSTNPNGVKYNSDNIANGGIVIGGYNPGAGAYVKFEVKLPNADQLACGKTEFRNVGVVRPEGMNEFYNTAITVVNKECANVPAQTVPTNPNVPTVLPNTGAGDVAGIFAAVTVAGALGHRLVLARRFDA